MKADAADVCWLLPGSQILDDLQQSSFGRQIEWIPICSSGNCREGDALAVQFPGETQALTVNRPEQVCFLETTSLPDWPDCMEDVAGGESAGIGNHCMTCRTTFWITFPRLLHRQRSSRSMDGSIHTSTSSQSRVGGIHDGVGLLERNISHIQFQ